MGGGNYEMALRVDADGDTITIDFLKGDPSLGLGLKAEPEYTDLTAPDKVTGFIITTGFTNIGGAALALRSDSLRDAGTDFTVWNFYNPSVTYIGTLGETNTVDSAGIIAAQPDLLTGTRGLVFDKDTPITEIIADFSGTDVDNLQPLIYSLTDSTENNDGDASYFTIDEATGELRRNADKPPTFATGTGADNIYDITITVSDGTNTDTYDLRVVVADTL